MAHGIVQPNGEPSYVFRMICSSSDGPSGFTFALTPSEAQKLSTKLAKIAVPLASKLEAIAESMDKLSKDRAKKNGR